MKSPHRDEIAGSIRIPALSRINKPLELSGVPKVYLHTRQSSWSFRHGFENCSKEGQCFWLILKPRCRRQSETQDHFLSLLSQGVCAPKGEDIQ